MSSSVSFWETFAQVPDPRDASGRRHRLQPVLALASVTILSGARSLYAIAVRAGPGIHLGPRWCLHPSLPHSHLKPPPRASHPPAHDCTPDSDPASPAGRSHTSGSTHRDAAGGGG